MTRGRILILHLWWKTYGYREVLLVNDKWMQTEVYAYHSYVIHVKYILFIKCLWNISTWFFLFKNGQVFQNLNDLFKT